MKFLRHILTADAKSQIYDLTRSLTFAFGVGALLLEGFSVLVLKQPFNIQNFGIGCGAILAAGGAAAWARKDTE